MNKELLDLLRKVSSESDDLIWLLQGSHTFPTHKILLQEAKQNLVNDIKQLLTKLEEMDNTTKL